LLPADGAAPRTPAGRSCGRRLRVTSGRNPAAPTEEPTAGDGGSNHLPIYQHRKTLVDAVSANQFLIVTGETGSGKTTQLPQYLYQAGLCRYGKIAVTQPRRVAAITVAQRVSHEMGVRLGLEVGYLVRFDDCTTKDTLIKYMTDGCMLRDILGDPGLIPYSVVILDEVHERSLNTDVLLGLLKKTPSRGFRGRTVPLKVVVMSATLETEKLSAFLDNCPVFTIPGRTFPVKELFCGLIGPKDKESSVYVKEVSCEIVEASGDILVFLTGQSEIEKACDLLFEKAESIDYRYDMHDRSVEGLLILPLYGSMPTDQQRQIFQPAPAGIRKCVVATNIAATSLTISGIRYIVDSGFVKQLNHNSRVGLDILEVVPISKFPYLDRPEERFILTALKQLYQYDAIDRKGDVTRLGRLMVELPLPPGLSRALLKSASLGCEELLLPVAAMLSVENILIRPGRPEKQKQAEVVHKELAACAGSCNDFLELRCIFEKCKTSDNPSTWCKNHWIHWRAVKSAFSVETQLRDILLRLKQQKDFPKETFRGRSSELLRQCLCLGYFTNVARRSVGKAFCTMDGHGSTVHIHPSSSLFGQELQLDWIIFHDVLVTGRVYVRTVCPIRYEWVRDLLPKLHEIDVYELSSVAREEVTDEEMARWEKKRAAQRQTGILFKTRKNSESSISEARETT
uniref:RNA helicase n=1 Tax=Electrophorus electricus TaxID=8005 RepID=A0A4W4DVY2_ELEEL